jgi:hypothetical protein
VTSLVDQLTIYSVISINYVPDPSLDQFAQDWADQTRDIWNQGQPNLRPTAYVNYAFGDEGNEQWYGYEPWRLEKLRSLKALYDPNGAFNYYNPIVISGNGTSTKH